LLHPYCNFSYAKLIPLASLFFFKLVPNCT